MAKSVTQSFKNICTMSLVAASGEEIPINPEYITAVATDYKYTKNVMPIIYTMLEVDLNLYDKLITNATDSQVNFKMQSFNANVSNSIQKNTINDRFLYFVPTKYNYSQELKDKNIDRSLYTKDIILGLMKSDLIAQNRTSFNGIWENTDTESLLEKITDKIGSPIVMDEIDNVKEYDSFALPPQSTMANALDYLFTKDPFYNTNYIFFLDFDKGYLLNSTGKARGNKADNTIIIDIKELGVQETIASGMVKNGESGATTIYVSQSEANISLNTTTEKHTNQIVATDTDTMSTADLTLLSGKEDTNRTEFTRATPIGADIRKQALENTSVILNITKRNINSSIITPDKCYKIRYDNSYYNSNYGGTYLLVSKNEETVRSDESFDTITMISFRRIAAQ